MRRASTATRNSATSWSPSIGVGWWPAPARPAARSAGRAFRVPTFTERYYPDPPPRARRRWAPKRVGGRGRRRPLRRATTGRAGHAVRAVDQDVIDWLRAAPPSAGAPTTSTTSIRTGSRLGDVRRVRERRVLQAEFTPGSTSTLRRSRNSRSTCSTSRRTRSRRGVADAARRRAGRATARGNNGAPGAPAAGLRAVRHPRRPPPDTGCRAVRRRDEPVRRHIPGGRGGRDAGCGLQHLDCRDAPLVGPPAEAGPLLTEAGPDVRGGRLQVA